VEIRSEPSSGKLFPMNMVLTQQELIMEIPTSNLKELMFISMKPPEDVMSQEQSLWISNQEPWTVLELDHLDNSSDQITSFLDKLEQETIGQKVTTQKELNLLIQYLMLLEKKPKDVIVYKDFK